TPIRLAAHSACKSQTNNEGFSALFEVEVADLFWQSRAKREAHSTLLGLVPASIAMPAAPLPIVSDAVQVHGCHHHYAHDMSGWHRHDKECRTLRGVVGRKNRVPAKS